MTLTPTPTPTPGVPGREELGAAIGAVASVITAHYLKGWASPDIATLTGAISVICVYLVGFIPPQK